jgi:hypothetical protein
MRYRQMHDPKLMPVKPRTVMLAPLPKRGSELTIASKSERPYFLLREEMGNNSPSLPLKKTTGD